MMRYMKPRKPNSSSARRPFSGWHVGALALFCFLLYANALSGMFVWDDEVQILRNPVIRDFGNLGAAFTSPFWSFAISDSSLSTNYYRPIQTVAYMIAYSIGGLDPLVYHLISIAFHAGATIFVYLLGIEFSFSREKALLAASLFACHAVHTEAVSWIAGMPDVSCGFFYIGAMWAFLKFQNTGIQRRQWVSALLFLGALFCKEMAFTLPVVLVLLGLFRLRTEGALKKVLRQVIPHAIVFGIYLICRYAVLGVIATSQTSVEASLIDWATMVPAVFVRYVWYALVPYPLVAYHLVPLHLQDRVLTTALGSLVLVLVAAVAFKRRLSSAQSLWLIALVIMLAPVFYFRGISATTFFAERYLYIPSLAVVLLAVDTAGRLRRHSRTVLWSIIAVYAALTFTRNPVWRDSETLYLQTLEDQPEVVQFRNSLADIYLKKGDDGKAKTYLDSAQRYLDEPVYAHPRDERYRTYVGQGAIAARARDYAAARKFLEQALTSNPRGDWAFLYLGGIAMEADSNYPEAIRLFQKAIELGPVNETARDYMGIAFLNQGNHPEAIKYFQEALRINPNYADARLHLDMARKATSRNP